MDLEELEQEYAKLYPDTKKLYGPYVRKSDGRKQITIRKNNNKITSKQYAKILLEIKLGRTLGRDETVDHVDGNFLNDAIDNLQLLTREDNASKAVPRIQLLNDSCVYCDKIFELSRDQITAFRHKHSKNKAGPFCSRKCSGKYGAAIQNDRMEALQRPEYKVQYYKMDDVV